MATSYLDNYYARLGVSKFASQEEIREAYHLAAKKLHPDTNKDPAAIELFLNIQEAYETLADRASRAKYDQSLPEDISPPPDVMISTSYSRTVLPTINSSQLVYVLIDMLSFKGESDDDAGTGVPPLNISIVLDVSTSMKGARLDNVKRTANRIIKNLKSGDVVSIITFSDRAEIVVPASRADDFNYISTRVSQITASGGTEIFQGLNAGFSELKKKLDSGYINHLFLITDGRTYGDEDLCLNLAAEAAEKGVAISAIGIGSEWNDEFLEKITVKTGGSTMFASEDMDIESILSKRFEQVAMSYANQVKLEFKECSKARLKYAFRLSPEPGNLNINSPIILGDVPLNGRLSLIMEFMVDPLNIAEDKVDLIDGTIDMVIPSRTIPKTSSRIQLFRPAANDPDLHPPPQVLLKAMSRLTLFRIQEQANKDLVAGEVDKALKKLHNLNTQLLAAGEPGLAKTVLLQAKEIEKFGKINPKTEKRVRFGTRALMLPSGLKE